MSRRHQEHIEILEKELFRALETKNDKALKRAQNQIAKFDAKCKLQESVICELQNRTPNIVYQKPKTKVVVHEVERKITNYKYIKQPPNVIIQQDLERVKQLEQEKLELMTLLDEYRAEEPLHKCLADDLGSKVEAKGKCLFVHYQNKVFKIHKLFGIHFVRKIK